MEKEDKKQFWTSVRELRKWAKEENGRCVLVIAGNEEGGFTSVGYSSYLRMAEVIANAIQGKPKLLDAMKIGVAAAESHNRRKEEKESQS